MDFKIIGYLLLTIGLVVIVLTALNVYQIFKGQANPANYFDFSELSSPLTENLEGPAIELLSPEVINDTTNLITHLFVMGFLGSVGFRIAMIGTRLVRPIIIKSPPNPNS